MGWDIIIIASLNGCLTLLCIVLYTRVRVLETQTPMVLDAWKKAESSTNAFDLAGKGYEMALTNKNKVEALEDWAKAITAHSQADASSDLNTQMEKIMAAGNEDFQSDLEAFGFNAAPTQIDPEETV